MREIKFQFIDKTTRTVITDYVPDSLHRMLEDPNLIPMQYIGKKDKNGDEIYEHHVVQGVYETYNSYFDEEEVIEFTSDIRWKDTGFAVNRPTFNSEGRLRDYGYQLEWDASTVEIVCVNLDIVDELESA